MDSSVPSPSSQPDLHLALEAAIASAEHAFNQLKLTSDLKSRSHWTSKAQGYVLEAERIKTQLKSVSTTDNDKQERHDDDKLKSASLKQPNVTRALPKSEQILLLKASYVNGNKYPPWSALPDPSEFEPKQNEQAFTDDAIYSISRCQEKVFSGWQRPQHALMNATMTHTNPIDLVQDASTDCSVVASLCAGVARQKRGHAKLTSSVIYPWDSTSGYPMLSPNGKYIIRLNFNGCFRRVVIDDRLPTSRTERFIHVVDRQNPSLLWPALVEKAYLKVRGGYDFPGSNSATDLWIITGWLPEQVFLQATDLDLNELWSRMWHDWSKGDVLITMGTGKMSKRVEKEVGLAGEHDYAVLDLKDVQGQRLMLVKNPWCEGTNWHRVPNRSNQTSTPGHAGADPNPGPSDADTTAQSPRDLLNADAQLSPGTFWMDIDNAVQYFESIYLNWNPGRFTVRQDLHFVWDLSSASPEASSKSHHALLRKQPQFSVSVADGGCLWLLLSRHLDKTNETSPTASAIDLSGFISLSAYAAGGKRINLTGKAINKSNLVDSPQILLKMDDCVPGERYTILAAEQELPRKSHTFTISAFGSSELDLDYATAKYRFSSPMSASWTRETAGGNANSTTYGNNPQFSLILTKPTPLSLLLESDQDALNVHIKLVHGNTKRVRTVRNRDVVIDSGDYRRRCCVAECKGMLNVGTYTAICSTFEPQQIGRFELVVETDLPVQVSLIPREGAGRFSSRHTTEFPHGSAKVAASLTPRRLVSLYTIASAHNNAPGSNVHLRLSIEQGKASHRRVIIASEDDLSNVSSGQARTDDFDLSPDLLRYGQLWLVLTRMCVAERALRQAVDIDLLTDQADAVVIGEWTSIDE